MKKFTVSTLMRGKRQRTQRKAKKEIVHPYLRANHHYNELYGHLQASKNFMQIIVVIALVVSLACIGGLIYISSLSQYVPYIVEVDKLGQYVAVKPASNLILPNRVIKAEIASFVHDSRMVTPDAVLQTQAINRLYAKMKSSDAATAKMTEWLNGDPDKNPFARAATETVTVDIESVVPQTEHTWLVDWTEKSFNRDGSLKQNVHMRATVSYYIAPPETPSEEQIRKNPLGIYISDFHWARRLEQQ